MSEFKLGRILDTALLPVGESKYEVRIGRIELLLGALSYMLTCADPLIDSKTIECFEPLFHLMDDVRERWGEVDPSEEFEFPWGEFVAYVTESLLEDGYIKGTCRTYSELIKYLDTFKVPVFFLEHYGELYEMNALYFPRTRELYYCYYRDEDKDSSNEAFIPADTLRVLNLRKNKANFYDGDIIYTGVLCITYIKRNHSIIISFPDSDWFVNYLLEKREVATTYRGRFLLGASKEGHEVMLRDNDTERLLEIIYLNKREEEIFVMNYDCRLFLVDGVFQTNPLYHLGALRRAYSVDVFGIKQYCSDYLWKQTVWKAIIDGIEEDYVWYFAYGCGRGVINRILRVRRNEMPPEVFSLDEIELRMRYISKETVGRELNCEVFSVLKAAGVPGDIDLFDFFVEAAAYWTHCHVRRFMYDDRFVELINSWNGSLVECVTMYPDRLFVWDKSEIDKIADGKTCRSIKEFFGK